MRGSASDERRARDLERFFGRRRAIDPLSFDGGGRTPAD
jgi:hypothetical protein